MLDVLEVCRLVENDTVSEDLAESITDVSDALGGFDENLELIAITSESLLFEVACDFMSDPLSGRLLVSDENEAVDVARWLVLVKVVG